MQPLFSPYKQKVLATLIATIGVFVGFQALSYVINLYQLSDALYLALAIYILHLIWLMFIFDLHLKDRGNMASARDTHNGWRIFRQALKLRFRYMMNWHHVRHFQNHLVLPGLLYWSCVILIFLNPFKYNLKQGMIIATTAAMNIGFWYMKEHVSRKMEDGYSWIRMLSLVKLFAAFMTYSAMLGVTIHFGYEPSFLVLGIFTLTFLLIYQALFQHNLLTFSSFLWIVTISLVMALVSIWVYLFWNTQYFTAGLVLLSIYNTMWSILHHHLDKNLTKKLVFEYLLMTALIISFLLTTHNFNQRIV